MMFRNAPAAAALLAMTLTAAPAFANEGTQVKVVYGDLDLTTVEGQRALERRLDAAAREACGYEQQVTGTRLPSSRVRNCYKQATAKARNVMAAAIENAGGDNRLGG